MASFKEFMTKAEKKPCEKLEALGNKSIKLPTKVILPIVGLLFGAVFFYIGFFDYGFWDSAKLTPTKGFFPVIISVALMAISVVALLQGLKDKSKFVEFKLHNWFVPAALLFILLVSSLTGFVIAIVIFEILWLRFYERQSWLTTLVALAIVLFLVVGCFQMWLGISFPRGIILEAIFG